MVRYTELRSNGRRDMRQAAPLPFPLTVHIETTNVCNFRCVHCPTGMADYAEQAGYYQHMPMELYRKIIADMVEFGEPVKSLKMYHLGEPLLNRNLATMIRMAREAGITERIEITSNCALLTRERAIELLDCGLEYLRVSVYGTEDAVHAALTKSKANPRQILENVRQLKALRDERGLRTPFLIAQTLAQSPEENARFKELWSPVVDEVSLEYPHDWNGVGNAQFTTSSQGRDWDACFPQQKQACAFPFYTLAVRANGSVVTCCVDWNGGTTVGDVRHQSLLEIWRGERLLKLQMMHLERRRHENSSCANCTALYRSPDSVDELSSAELKRRWLAMRADDPMAPWQQPAANPGAAVFPILQ